MEVDMTRGRLASASLTLNTNSSSPSSAAQDSVSPSRRRNQQSGSNCPFLIPSPAVSVGVKPKRLMVAVRFKVLVNAQFFCSIHRALKSVPIQYNPKGRLCCFYQARSPHIQLGGKSMVL